MADAIPMATPEACGMRSEQLAKIDSIVEAAIAEGRMPGCVIGVGRHGKWVC